MFKIFLVLLTYLNQFILGWHLSLATSSDPAFNSALTSSYLHSPTTTSDWLRIAPAPHPSFLTNQLQELTSIIIPENKSRKVHASACPGSGNSNGSPLFVSRLPTPHKRIAERETAGCNAFAANEWPPLASRRRTPFKDESILGWRIPCPIWVPEFEEGPLTSRQP